MFQSLLPFLGVTLELVRTISYWMFHISLAWLVHLNWLRFQYLLAIPPRMPTYNAVKFTYPLCVPLDMRLTESLRFSVLQKCLSFSLTLFCHHWLTYCSVHYTSLAPFLIAAIADLQLPCFLILCLLPLLTASLPCMKGWLFTHNSCQSEHENHSGAIEFSL